MIDKCVDCFVNSSNVVECTDCYTGFYLNQTDNSCKSCANVVNFCSSCLRNLQCIACIYPYSINPNTNLCTNCVTDYFYVSGFCINIPGCQKAI